MTTRAKPKEIVAESQKIFGVVEKGSTWIALPLAVVTILAVIIWEPGTPSKPPERATRSEVPLASAPRSTWLKLVVDPGGTSKRIPLPLRMHHIVVAGNKYQLHTVYADGRECASFGKETCPEGAVTEYYVTNEAQDKDILSYAFVSK